MNTLSQRLKIVVGDELVKEIDSWSLTQKDAAKRLQITQPRISNLLKKKYEEFSIEFLLNLLEKTELDLAFTVLK